MPAGLARERDGGDRKRPGHMGGGEGEEVTGAPARRGAGRERGRVRAGVRAHLQPTDSQHAEECTTA